MLPLALSCNTLARAIGVTPARVSDIAIEKRGIIADTTTLRLGRYFGTTADVWIKLQKWFELEVARRELGNAPARIRPRATGRFCMLVDHHLAAAQACQQTGHLRHRNI
ncbi:HigA family addiction module antitoxin [Rhodanobacter thiooxydans]|uniref:HigA family addiction module antitoxin n=1 Tax=Rhodanobacter thiooxydans TaxID=416169 RepID=UPI000D39CD5E